MVISMHLNQVGLQTKVLASTRLSLTNLFLSSGLVIGKDHTQVKMVTNSKICIQLLPKCSITLILACEHLKNYDNIISFASKSWFRRYFANFLAFPETTLCVSQTNDACVHFSSCAVDSCTLLIVWSMFLTELLVLKQLLNRTYLLGKLALLFICLALLCF